MTDFLKLRDRGSRMAATVTLLFFFAVLMLVPAPASAWEYSEFSLDGDARLAMMASAGRWNPYLEIRGVFHGSELAFRYNSLTAGSYFRAAPWLKLGAFYRLQGGARHLEDWTVEIGPVNHYWENVSPWRYENLLILDATPRFLLPWMGDSWVAAVKTRYTYNFYNDNQTLLVRPGLTWVMMKDREPLLNLSLQVPLYFALNFNDTPFYGVGTYISALWHLEDWLKLEGRLTYLVKNYEKWDFGGAWILHSHHLGIGLGLVFTPRFGD